MIKIAHELSKIKEASSKIASIGITLNTDRHIDDLLKASHNLLAEGFIMSMSAKAITRPKEFGHMYEWNRIGDPTSKLWQHKLYGRGKIRTASFVFIASKTKVPVQPELSELGVKERHVFRWKAPILEYGFPVSISPKDNPQLVFFAHNFAGNPLVITAKTIKIPRQGNNKMWGSFTREFSDWWDSARASEILEASIVEPAMSLIETDLFASMRTTKMSPKTFNIKVAPFDQTLVTKLGRDLSLLYRSLAGPNEQME